MMITAPIPSFALGHPQTTPAFRFDVTLPSESLTERHRPATLDAMVGQGAAVWQLQSFLGAPVSQAFLFSGPTGVGKTTAARALANDLGISLDWGFHIIKSAEADADAVDDALRMLRHSCPVGSGWKMVLVDEADLMTPKASHLWLSALEDLPPKSIVVFTTNRPEHFPDRFLDRCERLDFASDRDLLWQDAETLVDRIWLAETGRTDPPRLTEIPGVVDKNGRISFRRCVAALDPMIRQAAKRAGTMPLAPPTVAPVVLAVPTVHPVREASSNPVPAAPIPASKPASVAPAPAPATPKRKPASPRDTISIADPAELRTIDAQLAALEERYEAIGEQLLAMDEERDALKAARKRLAMRTRRA